MTRKETLANEYNKVIAKSNAIVEELQCSEDLIHDTLEASLPDCEKPLPATSEALSEDDLQSRIRLAKARLAKAAKLQAIVRYYATPEGAAQLTAAEQRLDQICTAIQNLQNEACTNCRREVKDLLGDPWTAVMTHDSLRICSDDANRYGIHSRTACTFKFENARNYSTHETHFTWTLTPYNTQGFDPLADDARVASITAMGLLLADDATLQLLQNHLATFCDQRDYLRSEYAEVRDILCDPITTPVKA